MLFQDVKPGAAAPSAVSEGGRAAPARSSPLCCRKGLSPGLGIAAHTHPWVCLGWGKPQLGNALTQPQTPVHRLSIHCKNIFIASAPRRDALILAER